MKKLALIGLLLAIPVLADGVDSGLKTEKAQQMAKQLTSAINDKLKEIAAYEMAAGVAAEDIQVDLSQQETFNSGRFGALLHADALGRVISVTPKSQASLLGLQSGDVIISINDQRLRSGDESWRNQLQYVEDHTDITMIVRRGDEEVKLTGNLKAQFTPGWHLVSEVKDLVSVDLTQTDGFLRDGEAIDSALENMHGCGRIIIRANDAKKPQLIAVIHSIDESKKYVAQLRHKVSAGYHKLKLYRSSGRMGDGLDERVLLVRPNTNYYLVYEEREADDSVRNIDTYLSRQYGRSYFVPAVGYTREQACD